LNSNFTKIKKKTFFFTFAIALGHIFWYNSSWNEEKRRNFLKVLTGEEK